MSTRSVTLLAIAFAAAAAPLACMAETIAIIGGRIHTLSSIGVIEQGTVLIEGDRIAAVGTEIAVPAGARIVDARGAWVTPGIFNSYTHLGLVEVEAVPSAIDNEAATAPFTIGFDVQKGIEGHSALIPVARARGVTRAAIFPVATQSAFAGIGALIHLNSGDSILFQPRALAFVELGASGASRTGGARGALWEMFTGELDQARQSRSRSADSAALQAVLSGQMPLVAHVERAADILHVLELRERYPKLRPVLLGANEGWRVADRIASARVPVILDSFSNLPADFELLAATQENAARLAKAGVRIAITPIYRFHAAMPHNAGLVTQYAGNAVANGLPWKDALAAITLNPALIFGVAGHLGSLEAGKLADVVVWDGDPLELSTHPKAIFIAGEPVSLESRQSRLRDRYRHLADPTPFFYRH